MDYKCKWCEEVKPEELFIKRNTKEPYSEKNIRCCRVCNQKRNQERYKVPEIRDKQLVANAKWRKEHPERMEEFKREFHKRTPKNQQARNKVGYMIRRGYWTKQPCEVCGSMDNLEAHHDSYAEAHWTTVRWLCKEHHEQWHQALDPAKGPILEEPLAEVSRLRQEHDEIQRQMSALRKRALACKKLADEIEFDAWSKVQKVAVEIFSGVFRSK